MLKAKKVAISGTSPTFEDDYDLLGYTAFGKYQLNSATTNSINPFGYNGEVTDSDTGTGLIYLRNRYYDPEIGRFLTVDPAMDGTNWYAYCENDPVNFVDPWGLYNLEKDAQGRIYAYIENGDTLSGIALAEVNDAQAYTKMNYEGNPDDIKVGQKIEITGIYNEYYPKENAMKNAIVAAQILPNYSKPMFTFSVEFGTGVYGEVRAFGLDVEIGGKRYYDLTTAFTNIPTESLQLGAEVKLTNKIRVGASYTGTVDAVTREHLQNEGYAGIKIGDKVLGFSNFLDNDMILGIGVGAYIGVGGEINLEVNFSEIKRRYFR